MAGQAEKKRATNASTTIVYYKYSLAAANLIYILDFVYRHFFQGVAPDISLTSWLWTTALFTAVSYWTYTSIESSLKQGLGYDYYQDVFIINAFVQISTSILPISWAWYIWWVYLAIPAFAVYKLYGMAAPFLGGGDAGPAAGSGEEVKSKTQTKKEVRGQKYKFMKG